jgi:hypothetical protein
MDNSLKDRFDKYAYAWQVHTLSTEKYLEYENGVLSNVKNTAYGRRGILLATGIYSERTAHLLNYIFNHKRWTSAVWDFHQGGGFIVDCGTTVRIGKFNEVCFDMTVKYIDFPRHCKTLCVVKPKIYKMVKSAIKDYMKFAFIKENIKVKKEIDDNGYIIKNVSIYELKVVIDYFNWQDVRKSYSPELIDKVFGKKTENQFAISATEVIENQIKELIEERKAKIDENSARFSKVRDWISKKWRDAEAKIKDEYNEKIKELEDQIKEMSANF